MGCYISISNTFVDLITPIQNEILEHNLLYIYPESASDILSFHVKAMGTDENTVGSTDVSIEELDLGECRG
jgi:hypothetical protein